MRKTYARNSEKAAPTARKLNAAGRSLVRASIVAGLTNSEIRAALQDAGHPHDLSNQTFTNYRKDAQVQADIAAALQERRQYGLVSRKRLLDDLEADVYDLNHRLRGTVADMEFPFRADPNIKKTVVLNKTFGFLLDRKIRLVALLLHLLPDIRTSTAQKTDADGKVLETTTLTTDLPDLAEMRRIAALGQANDAMEALLDHLEATLDVNTEAV